MADDTLTMFGKTYNTVGSANTNLMLQTKGDLKIRWGNKFIDLVKNGKINAESDVLKTADSSDGISSDGIFVVRNGDKDEIWIRIGKTLVNVNQEVPQEYISYKEEQKLTGEERQIALSNIGMIFDTYTNLSSSGIKNGIAYVLETQQFFSIVDGQVNEYNFETKIQDPLELGNITIQGSAEKIIGKTVLTIGAGGSIKFKLGEAESVSIDKEKIIYNQYISSNKGIQSYVYNSNQGFYVGINDQNKAIGVFDEIIVRNGITNIQQVDYNQLRSLIKSKSLVTGTVYEIIDFQDLRNVTYDSEVVYEDTESTHKNVYPIRIKAKNPSELESQGYFVDNPSWTVEYDPNYYHIIKYSSYTEEGATSSSYNIAYSKGRITKLTDEFGNVANFDFKHSTLTDDNKYLFNIANPRIKELDKLIEVTSSDQYVTEKTTTGLYADASQDMDSEITIVTTSAGDTQVQCSRVRNTAIVNNTIYLAEPTLETCEASTTEKMVKFNDYIIFDDCSTLTPNNNTINNVQGKYKILKQFEGNTFEGIVYKDVDEYQIFPILVNNIARTIYLKDDNGQTLFNVDSTYRNNTFGNIAKTTFSSGLTNNSFKNLENVIIDNLISGNTFEQDLSDLHILSSNMHDNVFKGSINTYTNISTYIINGVITNNVFEGDLDCVTFNSTCTITNNKFTDDIKYQNSTYTVFNGDIDKCQLGEINGCIFGVNSQLYNVIFYNEELYLYSNMTLVTVDKLIRNSVFKGDITNVHLFDDIDRVTFEGILGNTSSSLGKITSSSFNADVQSITATNATIINSTFDGAINGCEITGAITNCSFKDLSENIQIAGPLSDVDVQANMTPNTASYVESSTDSETFIANTPFIISTQKVPKLSISGDKVCTIVTKTYNNSNIQVFSVRTSIDDYTPSGVVVMFNGQANQIPSGWAICDGTKGTPDLRGRFIRMISANEAVGAKNNSDLETNGNGTRQAYLKKVPKHTHVYKTYSQNINADYSGLSIGYNGYPDISNLSIGNSEVSVYRIGSSGTDTIYYGTASGNKIKEGTTNQGSHTHTISGNITLPSISVTGDIKVNISMTPEQDTDTLPTAVNVEPQAYAIIFIMKL